MDSMEALEEILMTVREYSLAWLEAITPALAENTLRAYKGDLDRHILPALGGTHLTRITRRRCRAILSSLRRRLSKASVNRVYAVLRGILAAAVEDELIENNPASDLAQGLRLSTRRREAAAVPKALSTEHVGALLAAANGTRWGGLILFMLQTGLRISEALAVQASDVDTGALVVHVRKGKGGHPRNVEIAMTLRPLIRALPETGPLFPGVPYRTALYGFRAIAAKAELPDTVTWHSLRHTYAASLVAAGVSIEYVRRQLGHTDIRTTIHFYGQGRAMRSPEAMKVLADMGQPVDDSTGGAGDLTTDG